MRVFIDAATDSFLAGAKTKRRKESKKKKKKNKKKKTVERNSPEPNPLKTTEPDSKLHLVCPFASKQNKHEKERKKENFHISHYLALR